MTIEVIDHGAVQEVVVAEEFRRRLPEELRRALATALGKRSARICVNLEGITTTMSSAGLEVLTSAARELDARGERLALCGVSEAVARILDLTRLRDRFELVRSCADLTGDDDIFVLGEELHDSRG